MWSETSRAAPASWGGLREDRGRGEPGQPSCGTASGATPVVQEGPSDPHRRCVPETTATSGVQDQFMTRTLLRPGGASDSCPRESQVQVPARESLLDVLVREKRFGRPPAMPGAVGTGRQRRGDPDSIPGEELRL